jgi:hypothetical protein
MGTIDRRKTYQKQSTNHLVLVLGQLPKLPRPLLHVPPIRLYIPILLLLVALCFQWRRYDPISEQCDPMNH